MRERHMAQWVSNLITMVVGVVTILMAIYGVWNQNLQIAARDAERFAKLEEQAKSLGDQFSYRFTMIEQRLLRLEERK